MGSALEREAAARRALLTGEKHAPIGVAHTRAAERTKVTAAIHQAAIERNTDA